MFDRREGIGCSELAAIFDAHPYLTQRELWQRKLTPNNGIPTKGYVVAGNLYEPAIREWYRERHPDLAWHVTNSSAYSDPMYHPRWNDGVRLFGHPDGIIMNAEPGKTLAERSMWVADAKLAVTGGSRWRDGVPAYIQYQMHGLMMVAGCDAAQVVQCWDLQTMRDDAGQEVVVKIDCDEHLITADPALHRWIEDKVSTWWQVHVVEGIEPAWELRDLKALRKAPAKPETSIVLPDSIEEHAAAVMDADRARSDLRRQIRAIDANVEDHELAILAALGDSEMGATSGGYEVRRKARHVREHKVAASTSYTMTITRKDQS